MQQRLSEHSIPPAFRWLLVVAWMGVIFWFSAQPNSNEVTHHIFGGWNYVIRKCAHATEFAILFLLLKFASGRSGVSLLTAISYAALDEIHQTFVPNRSAAVGDVVIDSAGVLIAWLGISVIPHLVSRAKASD